MTARTLVLVLLVACKPGDKGVAQPPALAGSGGSAPTASFSRWITPEGVGPLNAATDPETVASLFPGMTAKTEHAEAEDYSNDDTAISNPDGGGPVLHVVVDNMRDNKAIFRVDVVGAIFATQKDIRVGSSVGDFAAAYPDASCARATYASNPEGFDEALYCESASLPNLTFHLDPKALSVPDGKVAIAKLAAFRFNRIIWLRPRPASITD
jgi:hypothetical protein